MSSPSSLRALLTALGREGQSVRLLLQHPGEPATSPYIAWENVDKAVDMQADQQKNVWFEVQPSKYTSRNGGRSSASDIVALSALYADIDYKDVSATRPGMGNEHTARELIADLSSALGLEPTAIVTSGHGLQPYWRLDGVITDGDLVTSEKLEGLLLRWGLLVQHFATARQGNVDNVFDLPRVLRVPGPDNLKDPTRPVATAIEFSDHGQGFTYEEIDQILDEYEIPREHHVELNTAVVSPHSDWGFAETNCSLSTVILSEIRSSDPGARHQWALKIAALIYGLVRNGCVTKERYDALIAALTERMRWLTENRAPVRPLNDKELRDILQYGLGMAQKWDAKKLSLELRGHDHGAEQSILEMWQQKNAPVTALPSTTQDLAPVAPAVPDQVAAATEHIAPVTDLHSGLPMHAGDMTVVSSWGNLAMVPMMDEDRKERLSAMYQTESGNAEHLAQVFSGSFIHVPGLGWHFWDGHRYVLDEQGRVVEMAKASFVRLYTEAQHEAAQKWFRKSMSRGAITSAISLTESLPSISVSTATLDADPYVLATPDGIIDLRAGTTRPAVAERDFVTKSTHVGADWNMPRPRFDEFILWAMQGDTDMVDYLQRLFGAALIGELRWHIFPIFLGPGANGKTTLLEVFADILGDYALQMPRKFLVASRNETHPTDIARLRGVRLAVASEVPPNATFDEDLVKQLAGEPKLTGRFMNKDYITFMNQGTHFLAANHLPRVEVGGSGFWRRVRKIDFGAIMPIHLQNPQLVRELVAEEGPAILAWAIDGAKEILATGQLRDPQKVINATLMYEQEEDELFRFLSDEVDVIDDRTKGIDRDQLFQLYRRWMYERGMAPLTVMKFNRDMMTRHPLSMKGDPSIFAGIVTKVRVPEFTYLDDERER
jgi:P4 family phage/plasmid primase-like protien